MASSMSPPPQHLPPTGGAASSQDEPTLGELVAGMTADMSLLMRKELELAKAELRVEAKDAGKAAGTLGAAAVTGYFFLLFISLAVAWGLTEIVPEGVAFLIVAIVYGIAAAVLASSGKKKLAEVKGPQQTVETLKEDAEWAKARMS